MKMRIIKTSHKTCKELLLYIDRNDDGEQLKMVAWHETKDGPMIQLGEINCEHQNQILLLERIINDFSEVSANEFINVNF